jgi:glycerol-3-phosphate acyltransferase PlsX
MGLALKAKKVTSKTSMAIGIDLVKNGQAEAFVTAGNTGGAMATAFFRLGVLPGVERPSLTGIFPTKKGRTVVLDIGANPECKPEHLKQFAIMGSLYARTVLGVENPRVGILSNGEEEGKGNQLIKETTLLLKKTSINFIGSVEGKELFGGHADVVVTDGFTGNILLKSSEAVASLLLDIVKDKIRNGPILAKLGGILVRPTLRSVKKMLDPAEVGAAPLLGINGLVFIGHGRSDQTAILSALKLARQSVESNLMSRIQHAITESLKQE